jgi:hypothetical protein
MYKFIFTAICLSTISLSAKIIETKSFSEVPCYVDVDTLLVLDIDDTLLIPVQMLGCDEWFTHRLNLHIDQGMSFSHALDRSLAEWEAIRHLTEMEVVEPGTEQIVKQLQEKGIPIMGLTTQGIALSHRTILQLKSHHLDLSTTAPFSTHHYFEQKDLGVLFRKGVLFTSGTGKGTALFTLCDHFGCAPKKIVFINDKATHLRDIETEAEKRGVEFIGLRYSYSDNRKAKFDPKVAELQFKNSGFHELLTDEQAHAQKLEILAETNF